MAEQATLETYKLSDYMRTVEDWKKRYGVGERGIYRGHTDFNWVLVAKLFRDRNAKPHNKTSDDPAEIEEQLRTEHLPMRMAHDLEHRLFHDFSRYLYAHRPDLVSTVVEEERSNRRAMQEWRQLALAQHYGVPTRFLDFTTNPLAALFFAVEEPASRRKKTTGEWEDQDSAVWCIEVANRQKVWQVWEKDKFWLSPIEFAKEGSDPRIADFVDKAFVPEHFDARIPAQGSLFMCEPRGKKHDWQLHVNLRDKDRTSKFDESGNKVEERTASLKIKIPSLLRAKVREQLDEMGVNRATLFPDLQGAAEYLAWAVHERKRPYGRQRFPGTIVSGGPGLGTVDSVATWRSAE